MKSLLTSVLWPAYEWGPCGLSHMRYLTTSYKEGFVKRDSRRMRDLVTSEWFQTLWPEIVLQRSGEASFANTKTGFREGVPFASLTGGRGDRVIIDDPHSTETAESEAERKNTTRIFRESVPTRLNSPEKSAIIVVMQRLHEDDVSGQIEKLKLGYDHLMLPMEFEPERRCRTSIGFTDPRTYEGELLFPERFPREVVERDKVPLGSYAVAGQFQQRPAPRSGGLFQRHWFPVVEAAPNDIIWVRAWDLAATEEKKGSEPAYTAGVKLGMTPDKRFFVGGVVRDRLSPHGVATLIQTTASQDGKGVAIDLPQDPGQAGKSQVLAFVKQLAGYVVNYSPETGDKVTRAAPVSAQAEAGNISLIRGHWNEAFLDELSTFPNGQFKDQVDALSRAFAALLSKPRPRTVAVGSYSRT
jgi:predicted phage terminase large subunit-like protein